MNRKITGAPGKKQMTLTPTRFEQMQQQVGAAGIDGWLLYDFKGGNPLAASLIGLPADAHLTRRYFVWVPREGLPILLVNGIEAGNWRNYLGHMSGGETVRIQPYSGHATLQAALGRY
jgi:hypothetical protein